MEKPSPEIDDGGERGPPAGPGGESRRGGTGREARVEDLRLDAGPPDVDGEDAPGAHARMIERVRLRGSSGLSPAALARARQSRWTRTRSAIGSRSACSK